MFCVHMQAGDRNYGRESMIISTTQQRQKLKHSPIKIVLWYKGD